jgi:hypothetical protein
MTSRTILNCLPLRMREVVWNTGAVICVVVVKIFIQCERKFPVLQNKMARGSEKKLALQNHFQ